MSVYSSPRISVNDLARFMVSSDTARIGIVRRSKIPKKPPIIRYRDVRGPICKYLSDLNRSVNPLVTAEEMLKQRADDPSESTLRQDDALHSIEVLHAIQGMSNQLSSYQFEAAHKNQSKLVLSGVEVSVTADLMVRQQTSSGQQIGLAILRMTQDDSATDAAKVRRKEMGLHVATLARLHLDQNFQTNQKISNKLCMSIDVQHGEAFQAPSSVTRRVADLTNACLTIAALWDQV